MVRVGERKGLFKVTRIDGQQRVADLLQRVGKFEVVEENVPLQLISTVPGPTFKAIQEFLHS